MGEAQAAIKKKMENKEVIKELIETKGATVLLGNGYNRRISDVRKDKALQIPPSWEDLVVKVNDSLGTRLVISEGGGITNPELFTAVSLAYDEVHGGGRHSILNVHRAVAKLLVKETARCVEIDEIQAIAQTLKKWDIPVITTNYDKQLEMCLGLNKYKTGYLRNTSLYYPVNCYYSDKKLEEDKLDKQFAIWHCNGVVDYVESLRLDLCDYCNYTAWLKKCVPMYGGTVNNEAIFRNSWLWPFFNNKLIIVGLSLDPSEFFLRWLLIRRHVWRKEEKGEDMHGYFLCGKDDKRCLAQKAFLGSVGIKILEYDLRGQIYEELFGVGI